MPGARSAAAALTAGLANSAADYLWRGCGLRGGAKQVDQSWTASCLPPGRGVLLSSLLLMDSERKELLSSHS